MSVDPVDPTVYSDNQELERALVLLYQLSDEAVERVNGLMSSLSIGFPEAALRAEVITRGELDDALEWVRRHDARRERSLIEKVLQRNAGRREITPWHEDELVPVGNLILFHDPGHPRSEAIRSLRTDLILLTKRIRRSGVIAVVSPCAGEGRSQLAAELAIAFAQLERRTLLVDADMRRPNQHVLFGTQNEHGLAETLSAAGPLHLHGVQGLPRMSLLTSGAVPPNPAELLSAHRFERVMAEWRRSFEFVVIDTPPMTQFSETLAVAAAAGSVLLLGRANVTRFSDLNEVRRSLSSTQSTILGAVINSF